MPILRHLMLVFPDDPQSRAVSDQFLLGDALLVAPVVEAGATTRRVYLPPGSWFSTSGPARRTRVAAPSRWRRRSGVRQCSRAVRIAPICARSSDRPDFCLSGPGRR